MLMTARLISLVIFLGPFVASGCGGSSAKVTGRITCQGKPVVGVVLFSPKGGDGIDAGPSVSAPLKEDGTFELRLPSIGKYAVVITPRDITLRPKPGEFDFPCDRSPLEREINAGDNHFNVELAERRQ